MVAFKRLLKNSIYILGFSATLLSFYLTIYNPLTNVSVTIKIILIVLFMLMNFGVAFVLGWPKSNINLNISNKIDLNIYYNDLFNQNGIIVIPVNEYFDTLVDERIISSSTLHGQFIKKVFGGNIEELEFKINKELQKHKEKSIVSRPRGNCKKYELGTTISVNKDGKDYFLVAFTRFNDLNKAESFNFDYQVTLKSLLDFIHINSQGKDINIPLIGAGQSGVNLTKQKLLEYLLFSIQIHDCFTVSGRTNIVLNKGLKDIIDLNRIKDLYSI
ncbi:macro domain-containing protein [Peribacillus frigoritolerans]|uniref:macro domain-containing protein n=1 Tax=Peribacillus frigoritolerans TaxID=450367 RepID=UPI00207A4C41|nr:macro domain-containing protein [Peribacillus frigoritolerans]USK64043.1 DUF6430 domain-containing protein [Peribacillus frigoritolerans]